MNATDILSRLDGVKKTSEGHVAKCPAHDDSNPSLSVTDTADRVLLHCHAGCSFDSVLGALQIKATDLFSAPLKSSQPRIVATYVYQDATGKPAFEVLRYDNKDFRQRKDASTWSLKGVERVLFRLPEITKDIQRGLPICICEGEKDVLAMVQRGFSATCNSGGAEKWLDSYSESLRGADVIIFPDKDGPGRKHAALVAGKLKGIAKSVLTIELPDFNGKPVKDAHDFFAAGGDAGLIQDMVDAARVEKKTGLAEKLSIRRFNIHAKPPELKPRFFIGNTPISTAGNLTAISAGIKSGKSSFIGAMLAATMATNSNADCLGVVSRNADGHGVIHLDTEQSVEDHFALIERAMRRAGLNEPPAWLQSYCVTGFSVNELSECLEILASQAIADFGGIHSILIDGAADMVSDVNDPAECNGFVATLHATAIKYACPIVGVIHFNPGTEKTRGHLGSQLERKAETNLRLDKDGESIVVWSEKNRRAPITKATGPRFTWSDDQMMHVSIESAGAAQAGVERLELQIEAGDVFKLAEKNSLSWTEFLTSLMKLRRLKEGGARKRFSKMIGAQVITKNLVGNYTLTT